MLCRLSWLTKVGGRICHCDPWAGAGILFFLFHSLVVSINAHFVEALIEVVLLSTLVVGSLHDGRIFDLERTWVRLSGLHSGRRSHICDQAGTLYRLRLIEKVERSRIPSECLLEFLFLLLQDLLFLLLQSFQFCFNFFESHFLLVFLGYWHSHFASTCLSFCSDWSLDQICGNRYSLLLVLLSYRLFCGRLIF